MFWASTRILHKAPSTRIIHIYAYFLCFSNMNQLKFIQRQLFIFYLNLLMDFEGIKEEASTLVTNPLDPQEFQRQGYMIIDFLTEYYKNIDRYPLSSQVEHGYLQKTSPMCGPNKAKPIGLCTDPRIPIGRVNMDPRVHFSFL